jgi:hypothetical protein
MTNMKVALGGGGLNRQSNLKLTEFKHVKNRWVRFIRRQGGYVWPIPDMSGLGAEYVPSNRITRCRKEDQESR